MSTGLEHEEADALLELARSLALSRPDMTATLEEVQILVGDAVKRDTPAEVERAFEQVARQLRAAWLKSVAAETARVLRSPTEREAERLARSRHDAYGYERDFQPETLEARCDAFFGVAPAGWTAAHVLFSSGQAALSATLLHLAEQTPGKLRVAHVGSYFETRELVQRGCAPVATPAHAHCVIVEPIACDGRFTAHDPAAIATSLQRGQALVIDETLSAPRTGFSAVLHTAVPPGVPVIRLVSGLKLMQQGLELANVGIVSVFTKRAADTNSLVDGLKRWRTLTGAGLRFVDALALEAPFFLDRDATRSYADRVFAHNAAMSRAVMADNRLFGPLHDAGLAGDKAPYCAFQLQRQNGLEALEGLAENIDRNARERGLLIERGGSFGFRGHRYEVIEPESGEPPFLRVAMGARDDASCRGLIELMAELASGEPAR